MARPFKIARLDDTGVWIILASYSTYESADRAFDGWCDRLPFAYIEIVDEEGKIVVDWSLILYT